MAQYWIASVVLVAMCLVYSSQAIRVSPKNRFHKRGNEGKFNICVILIKLLISIYGIH